MCVSCNIYILTNIHYLHSIQNKYCYSAITRNLDFFSSQKWAKVWYFSVGHGAVLQGLHINLIFCLFCRHFFGGQVDLAVPACVLPLIGNWRDLWGEMMASETKWVVNRRATTSRWLPGSVVFFHNLANKILTKLLVSQARILLHLVHNERIVYCKAHKMEEQYLIPFLRSCGDSQQNYPSFLL